MKKAVLLAAMVSFSALAGCASQAGPFVTNISSNGDGGIVVEKCMVNLNRALNTVEAADCNNHDIQLQARK
jgi:type IV secretion system protein VirB7